MPADNHPTDKLTYPRGHRLVITWVNRSCAILRLSNTPDALNQRWFCSAHWADQGKTVGQSIGRGTTLFFRENDVTYVLRHYCRGGFIRKFIQDSYLFTGIRRSRVYRELALLSKLDAMLLPVGNPVSAMLTRHGLSYRASIITRAIPNSLNLLEILRQRELANAEIVAIAKTLANFHRQGVDHADLNISNILLDTDGQPFLVDFDRGRIKQPSRRWQQANIKRLQRSFTKQKRLNPELPWTSDHWHLLMATYADEMAG